MPAFCVVLKYLAESSWCFLQFNSSGSRTPVGKALSFGLVRLLIGREAMLAVTGAPRLGLGELLLYAGLLVGRWFVWGFLFHVRKESAERNSPPQRASATRAGSRAWRVGGVLVSCLADVPALLTGIWVGLLWL